MTRSHMGLLCLLLSLLNIATSQDDATIMQTLRLSLKLTSHGNWSKSNPCEWDHVQCDGSNRVTKIQFTQNGIQGTLHPDIGKLTELSRPRTLNLHDNLFDLAPTNLFYGMNSLQEVNIDNNPFPAWEIPETVKELKSLKNLSLINCNVTGSIPDFFSSETLPSLASLKLSRNNLHGVLPLSLAGSSLQQLYLNGQKLNGSISVLQNMTSLVEIDLQGNEFSGPIPDLSGLKHLQTLNLQDNLFNSNPETLFSKMNSLQEMYLDNNPFPSWGIPETVKEATSLKNLSLANCSLTGLIPDFFRSETLPRLVSLRLSRNNLYGGLPESLGRSSLEQLYLDWQHLNGSISVLQSMTSLVEFNIRDNFFSGFIPDLSGLQSLKLFDVRDNYLTGLVPPSLTALKNLTVVNLSNNYIQGPMPLFQNSVKVDAISGRFCQETPGTPCDPQVQILISIAESFGFPLKLAKG
ncbi:Leucine-rich repeat protein kinase family protein [Raphanus sativus]|nr:Leucine-rich repeat protein kinase family protein [Raphanus sativus]